MDKRAILNWGAIKDPGPKDASLTATPKSKIYSESKSCKRCATGHKQFYRLQLTPDVGLHFQKHMLFCLDPAC